MHTKSAMPAVGTEHPRNPTPIGEQRNRRSRHFDADGALRAINLAQPRLGFEVARHILVGNEAMTAIVALKDLGRQGEAAPVPLALGRIDANLHHDVVLLYHTKGR